MNELSAIRKMLKGSGLALSAVTLLLWLSSTFLALAYMQYGSSRTTYSLRAGVLEILAISNRSASWVASLPRGLSYRRVHWTLDAPVVYRLGLTLPHYEKLKMGTYVKLPLWVPFCLILTPTLVLWCRDARRAKRNRGRIKVPSCSRPVRLFLSILLFPLLLIVQYWIVNL